MADLVPVHRDEQLPAFAPAEVDSARRYRDASRAESTRAKYDADWAAFSCWCQERGHPALPAHPGAVAVYLSALADRHLAPSTVGRILAAIGHNHRLSGLVAPHKAEGGAVILDVLAGIRRSRHTPPARKAAADSYVPHAVLRAIEGNSLADVRDRALLAFGMASALRRSELVALTVADLERRPDGLRVRVVRSKTDQEGRGVVIAVPDGRRLNPVAHLDTWLARAGISDGPVFRSLVNGRLGSHRPIGVPDRQAPGPGSGLRGGGLRGAQPAGGLPDQRRRRRSVDLENARGQPAQVGAGALRLCQEFGPAKGSCRQEFPMIYINV